jgi:hypothetical protein
VCLTSLRSYFGMVRVDFAKGVAPSKIKDFSSQTNPHALGDAVGRLVGRLVVASLPKVRGWCAEIRMLPLDAWIGGGGRVHRVEYILPFTTLRRSVSESPALQSYDISSDF